MLGNAAQRRLARLWTSHQQADCEDQSERGEHEQRFERHAFAHFS
jgi:hypothetical protein